MAEVIWSPRAADDLEAIFLFIGRDSPDQAARFIGRLLRAAARLADFPMSGGALPEADDPALRQIVHGNYRIVYRVREDAVWVSRVMHAARDWHPQDQ